MKKLKYLIIILSILTVSSTFAQSQGQGLMLRFGGYDFYGIQTGNMFTDDVYRVTYNPETKMNDTATFSRFRQDLLVNFAWLKPVVSDHFDVLIGISAGNVDMPASEEDTNYVNRKKLNDTKNKELLASLDLRFQYNILDRSHFVSPYLSSGFTVTNWTNKFGFALPFGIGANFNLSKERDLFFNLETSYKLGIGDNVVTHMQNNVGFLYFPDFDGSNGNTTPPPPPVVVDTDGDGVADDLDKCPTMAGSADLGGCPDSDGDGIADMDDQCPDVAGSAGNNGCPIADTDGDGINDDEDDCPSLQGLARYNGCPIPDDDNDGFNNEVDKCPKIASPTNNGCPVIEKEVVEKIKEAAGQVHFQSSKSVLTEDSDENLDIIAGILKDNPLLKCDIKGYTDASGPEDFNVKLSNDRAKVCYDYLVDKGVDPERLSYKGYGPADPVATNDTKEGRAKNRRTEFEIRNY